LAFYFLVASIHTFTYARWSRPLLDSFPRPLQALHAFYYTTIVTFPFLVTIVYWAILYKSPWFPREFNAFTNISQHAMNSVFALFEIVFTRTTAASIPFIHMLWLIVLLAMYLAVAYITHAVQGWYTYSFLDPSVGGPGRVAGYVFGIAAAILIVFLIVKGLVWVRVWLTEKVLHMDGKFAKQRTWREDVEMNDAHKS
jgi:hypothetical protein